MNVVFYMSQSLSLSLCACFICIYWTIELVYSNVCVVWRWWKGRMACVCIYTFFLNPIHCKNGYLMKLCGVYTPQSQPTKATPPFSIDHNFWLMHIVIICVCVCVCAILSSSRKYHTIQDHKSTLMVYFQLDSPLLISLKYKYDIGLYVYIWVWCEHRSCDLTFKMHTQIQLCVNIPSQLE